jgi:hypothetical protein
VFYFLLLSCKLAAGAYKQSKYADIRSYPTPENINGEWFFSRLRAYLILTTSIKEEKAIKREDDKKNSRKKFKADNRAIRLQKEMYHQFKKDFNSYLPIIVIWVTRVLMTFQVYMYHGGMSFYHLIWVLLSFNLTSKFSLFISIVIFLPLYALECALVYGSQIEKVRNTDMFKKFGKQFMQHEMINPMLEQTLYFVILSCFFIMISCYKLVVQEDQIKFLFKKFSDHIEFGSVFWKFMFFILKNI